MVLRELVNLIGFDVNEAQWKAAEKSMDSLVKKGENVGRKLSMYLTAPILALGGFAVKAQSESKEALAQIEQSLISTGNAAGKSVEELAQQAKNLQNATIMEDDAILRQVTAQLLTFTNIAGKEFDRVQQAVLDVSAKLDPTMNNLQSVAIQMGKAFNDPKNALSALTRSGIQFNDQQKKMINALIDSGKLGEAQRIMLKELERQYGGSAKALADNSSGVRQLKNDFSNLLKMFGADLLPMFKRITDVIRKQIKLLQENLTPQMRIIILVIGGILAAIGPLIIGFVMLTKIGVGVVSMFKLVTTAARAANLATGLFIGKMALIGIAVAAVIVILALLVEDIIAYVNGNKSLIGQFIEPWSTLGPKFKEYFAPIIILLNDLWVNVKTIFQGIIDWVMGIFTGDVDRAVKGIGEILSGVWEAIGNMAAILVPILWTVLQAIWGALVKWIPNLFSWLWKSALTAVDAILTYIYDMITGWIKSIIDAITGAFANIWDTLKNSAKGVVDKIGLGKFLKTGDKWFQGVGGPLFSPAAGVQMAGAVAGTQNLSTMNRSANKSLSVNSEIKVYVPQGTPESQASFAGDAARKAAEDVFNAKMNDLMNNMSEVE